MRATILAAVLISTAGMLSPGHASCAGAGQFYSGHVVIGDVKIDTYGLGLVLGSVGPAGACSDTAIPQPYVRMTIKHGTETCTLTENDGLTFGYDPFIFGAGFHAHGGECGADVTFDTLSSMSMPSPDPSDVGTDGSIVWVSAGRVALVGGTYWFDGQENAIEVPGGTLGREGMGVGFLAAV